MSYVIGVDIGTQSTKGLIMDAQGQILASASQSYGVINKKPLWAEQHAEVWLNATFAVIADLVQQSNIDKTEIKALCVSSLYGGAGIPVDESISPIYPCLIWMDRRADEQVQWVKENIDTQKLFSITGNSLDSYYGYTKILWLKQNESEIWQNTRYFLPPNSYINYMLTGEIAVDHSSAGNIGGVYDLANRSWSQEAMTMLGIPHHYMPEKLVGSGDIVGGLLPDVAEKLGLAPSTPVVAGGVDAAVATYAAGVCEPGDHVAMIGTSMCWGFVNHTANAEHGLISMPHVNNPKEDIYIFGGAITAGASISWFIDQFCQAEKIAAEGAGSNVHQLLEKEAKHLPPGADGLLFLPYLMGERSPVWDSKASGTMLGMSLFHTRHHLYRAVIEGVTFALRDNIECGKVSAEKLNDKLIVVGGAAYSDMWMQIIADITGYPVLTIKEEVEAPLGDCALAAAAVGLIENGEQIKQWSTLVPRATPDAQSHAIYNKLFEQYRALYQSCKTNMHALNDIAMHLKN
ncbi:FGGY-family carbohydrate kinase [Vibrio intestinalis]|uniref:FGGY-family carbohydrate kinase n=1 Tax=Vibrio intestinalis TaxID=2933291 RepID=UPI0021A5463A|nr:FGGY-family carbohydrate kinase [Vibrio intestinalis]